MPTPRFIDLQLSGKTLGDLVLNRARTQVFWSKDPLTLQNPNDGIIDHIAFDDNPGVSLSDHNAIQTVNVKTGSPSTVSAAKIRVDLGFHIFVKLISVAQDPSQPKNTYFGLPGGIPANLSVDISMQGAQPELCVEIVDWKLLLDIVPNFQPLHDKVLAQLQSAGKICVPFDPSGITGVLGSVSVQNAVFAAQTDANGNVSAICIRIEAGASPQTTQADWHSFVTGFQNTLTLDGPDWNVQIDPQLIVDFAVAQFQSGLGGMSGFTVDDPANGSWLVPGAFNGGQIAMSDHGHMKVDECPNNIGVTLSASVDLQFSNGNLIEHGFVDWDLTDSDVFVCGLTYGGPVGVVVGALIAGPIGAVVGGLIGTIIGVTVAAILASVFAGKKSLQGNFNQPGCTVVDQHHFTCTTSLELPKLDFGAGVTATLKAGKMLGLPQGLMLGGTASVTHVGDPWFDMSQPDNTEEIGVIGDCFHFQAGYSFAVQLDASQGPPSVPTTTLCADSLKPWNAVQVLNDPQNAYPYTLDPDLTDWLPLTVNFDLTLPQNHPYFNNPYRPALYVRTSSGSYSVRLPQLIKPTDAQLAGIAQSILKTDIGCHKLADGWLGQPGKYNPHWSVDPGPEGDINIWEIAVASPDVVGQISAQSDRGVELANAAIAGRFAQLSVAVSGLGGQIGGAAPIGFIHGSAAPAAKASAASRTAVPGALVIQKQAQTLVTERILRRRSGWSAFGETLRGVSLGIYQNQICAILAGSGGVEVVSLQAPGRPTLSAIIAGQRGALPYYSGLLTWNETGLYYEGRGVYKGEASQVVARSTYLYVLSGDQIVVFDAKLARAGAIAANSATDLAVAGTKLVAATPKGLDVFDLAVPAAPRPARGIALEGARGLKPPAIGGSSQRVLVELDRQQYMIVDVSGEEPYIAARYLQRPWFAGAAVYGDITVR